MDELVTDLTIALERTDDPQSSKSDTTIGPPKDSPSSTPVRKRKKRRGRKRRSDFPLTKDLAILSEESNDSIEEALKDYIENISMCQSDSDEDSALTSCRRLSMFYRLASKSDPYPLPERLETDPVNDTTTSAISKRRNKKMKRSKQQCTFGTFQNNTDFSVNCKSKVPRRSLKRKLSNRISGSACGETWTRRSKYEEGTLHEIDSGRSLINDYPLSESSSRYSKNVHFMSASSSDVTLHDNILPWQLDENPVDEVMACSDSESSSGNESEGFFTNDEGRLADDEGEESSFEQDSSTVSMQSVIPWWENESEELEDDQKFNNIVNGVMDAYGISVESSPTKGGFQARLNSIKCMHETNGMKPLVEANRKISKFLHDPLKSELSVQLTNRNEREKIYQLASLYSLHCRTENLTGGRIILIKTRNTCQADKKALNNLLWKDGKRKGFQASEVKRAKRMDKTPEVPGVVGNLASAIPEHNIGNQMLRSMGWVPGTGLGPDKGGIVEPISATLRPRKLGLGHSWPT